MSFSSFNINEMERVGFNNLCKSSLELLPSSISQWGRQIDKYSSVKISSRDDNILLIAKRGLFHGVCLLNNLELKNEKMCLRLFFQRMTDSKSRNIKLLIMGGSGSISSEDSRFALISKAIKRYTPNISSIKALKECSLDNLGFMHSIVIRKGFLSVSENAIVPFTEAYQALRFQGYYREPDPRYPEIAVKEYDSTITEIGLDEDFPEEFKKASILGQSYFIGNIEDGDIDEGMITELSEESVLLVARRYETNGNLTHIGMCEHTNQNHNAREFIGRMAILPGTSKIHLYAISMSKFSVHDEAIKDLVLAISHNRSKMSIKKVVNGLSDRYEIGINKRGHIVYGRVSDEENQVPVQENETCEETLASS